MQTRQEKILACIDPATQKGLEIGALNKPIVTREMGDIRYVDHASTEELKQKYASDPNVDVEAIVEVSYVWGAQTLPELVGSDAPFDYVVASHVIEHVPDLIGWMKEIHAVLKPGGILALAIPDKRYCFDYFRQPTEAADVVDAYLRQQRKPGPRQVFDFHLNMAFWKGQFAWGQDPSFDPADVARVRSAAEAWQITNQIAASDNYHDVHCWVFTPGSLVELLKILMQSGLIDYKVLKFYPSEGCEFFVALEAIDPTKDETARQQIQLESLLSIPIEEALPQQSLQPHGSQNQIAAKLVEMQQRLQQSQANLQRLRADKQRLREKAKNLQAELTNREQEIAALQSSKFWQLRRAWIKLKQGLHLTEPQAQPELHAVVPSIPAVQPQENLQSVEKPNQQKAQQRFRQQLEAQARQIQSLQNQLIQQAETLNQLRSQATGQAVMVQQLQQRAEQSAPILWKSATSRLQPPLPPVKELLQQRSPELDERIGLLREIIEQLGDTVQADRVRQLTDQELLTFVQQDNCPIPPSEEREGYLGDQHISYWILGLADYCFLKQLMAELGLPIGPQFSFLDLGCASGRVLRHFAIQETGLNLYGADIYRTNIDWIRTYLPQTITAFQNTVLPLLPLQSNSLDLIYAGSVFTHIDDLEEAWLLELRRVLKVGGVAFISIHSDRTWEQIRQHYQTHFLYKVFSSTPHLVKELGTTEITPQLFEQEMLPRVVFDATDHVIYQTNVFHSQQYIEQEWGRFFTIEKILSKAHGDHQDGVVLRKN